MDKEQEERKEMCDELKGMAEKYDEMVRKLGGPSLVERLLNKTDMPYSERVMVVSFMPKFKVS